MKTAQVSKWAEENLKLRVGRRVNAGYNGVAQDRGRKAADNINIRPTIKGELSGNSNCQRNRGISYSGYSFS